MEIWSSGNEGPKYLSKVYIVMQYKTAMTVNNFIILRKIQEELCSREFNTLE